MWMRPLRALYLLSCFSAVAAKGAAFYYNKSADSASLYTY
jgi:hypothetical protein